MLTIAISRDWKLTQLDISNTFLHGTLDERVVISQPTGFMDSNYPNNVCLLNKALYGLKQTLREFLSTIGFIKRWGNPSLFILSKGFPIKVQIFLFVYVDDMVLTCSNQVSREFVVHVLDGLSFFLGIQVKHAKEGLHLSQQQYLSNLLKNANLDNFKPSSTLMIAKQYLFSERNTTAQVREYRWIIRSLKYLTLTRLLFSLW